MEWGGRLIKSLEKALKILNFIAEGNGEPITLKEISSALGIHASTCSHILETMIELHYIEKASKGKGYVIGPEIYAIATRRNYKDALLRSAVPQMNKLCMELKETIVISTFVNGKLYIPYHAYYKDEKVYKKMTQQSSLFSSACGLVTLAFLDRYDLEQVKITSNEEFLVQLNNNKEVLKQIRKDGFYKKDEIVEGTSAVAYPIFANGKIISSIGVYMPSERFCGEHLEETLTKLKKAAFNITNKYQ